VWPDWELLATLPARLDEAVDDALLAGLLKYAPGGGLAHAPFALTPSPIDPALHASMEALTALPGVGRKTANVVLGHAFGEPGLPVDRHVLRVANRIGLARADDPEVVERQIGRLVPSEAWVRLSDALILHGRRVCRPRPVCDQCSLRNLCEYDEGKGRKKEPARAGRGG